MEADKLTERIIALAIAVHTALGPGLLESLYETALCMELKAAGLRFQRQLLLPVLYKGQRLGEYRLDLLIGSAASFWILLGVSESQRLHLG